MDPDAAYARLSEILENFQQYDHVPEVREALDLLYGLDGWLRKGGYLPTAWQNGREIPEN